MNKYAKGKGPEYWVNFFGGRGLVSNQAAVTRSSDPMGLRILKRDHKGPLFKVPDWVRLSLLYEKSLRNQQTKNPKMLFLSWVCTF